ncbi:hypothetical protein N0V88_004452 [Collariella sp. IMI 366227]|nr:hypothetical protein N0V88_004452 [Collariella sp. IMI 366227]
MELYLTFLEPHRIRYITSSGIVHDEYIEVRYEFTTIESSIQLQGDIRRRDLVDWFDVDVAPASSAGGCWVEERQHIGKQQSEPRFWSAALLSHFDIPFQTQQPAFQWRLVIVIIGPGRSRHTRFFEQWNAAHVSDAQFLGTFPTSPAELPSPYTAVYYELSSDANVMAELPSPEPRERLPSLAERGYGPDSDGTP